MKSSSRASNPFRSITSPLPSPLVMVCTPSRVGDIQHHQHAMTAPGLSLSAEPSAHYRLREHPIAGSSSCATRSEGHLALEMAEGLVASAPNRLRSQQEERWPVARYSA